MSIYLSCLTLAAGHNRTRSEIDHPYELHRTICKAWEDPESARILFRPEPNGGSVRVIVQSLTQPDWSHLEAPQNYLLETNGPKEVRFDGLSQGQGLAFRLRCRPSKRVGGPEAADTGKRKSLKTRDEIFQWLHRKAGDSGFEVQEAGFDRVYWFDSKEGKQEKPLGAVQFDGVLLVTDPDKLRDAVANGIGPQKAFGFGLLSLAPIQ